ncbi:sugar phosphate isomerase/epimerase family protein [Frondihabitans cladoniiphilus]|uniref:Sugar phosphate isomerase/epimerase n=1 Tax=Frondihabitans cladoniiphilus TaxID=715785 RepID=A0ABP8VHI3_9MICO
MANEPSVQLYTVRDAIADDLAGAIDRVAAIGFTRVEPYAFVEQASAYAAALKASGLSAPSGHAAVIDSANPTEIFEAAVTLGIETVIDPFIPSDRWQTADDAARIAERVNELSVQAKGFGLRFGYHNHQWEFGNKVDGRSIYHLFVDDLAPEVVLELDTFWSTVGGANTVELLKELGDRVQFIHVKDGQVSGDIADALPSSDSALVVPDELMAAFKLQVPAGSGDVDVAGILAAAPQALRVVEFDGYAGDVFEGIAGSFAWLRENDTVAEPAA